MKEKAALTERIRKSKWEITLGAICTISIISGIVSALLFNSNTGFCIFSLIAASAIMGIYSVYIYKKEALNQVYRRKLQTVIRIIWNYTILISVLAFLYKISISMYIPQDKSYRIYDFMAIYTLFSFTLKYVITFLEKRKSIIEKKEGILGHCLNVSYTVWMLLFMYVFGFYLFYIPINTIHLENVPQPYRLSVSEYKYNVFKLLGSGSRSIEIDDEKLLGNFADELSCGTVKNIRGAEYMMEEKRSRDELYYRISTQYKDSNGNDMEGPYVFDKIHFLEMRLYRNGDLILVNFIKIRFPFINYRTELYEVTLSPELTNQIIKLVETSR